MTIREISPGEATGIGDLFEDAVRTMGPEQYSTQQVEAWAASAADREAFRQRMTVGRVFAAQDETGLIGFATLESDGHVNALYVRGDRQRRGVGLSLLSRIIAESRSALMPRLYAEASAYSLPVFRNAGFEQVGTDSVERGGVQFNRYLVELAAANTE